MRILEVPPLWEQLPPKGYGAIEYLVAAQIEEFVANGHDVTTYASGDSAIAGELIPIVPKALNHSYNADPEVLRMIQFSECLRRADEYDVIHCHLHSNTGWMALPILAPIASKTIFSLHTFATEDNRKLLSLYPDCKYVAASEAHAKSFGLNFIQGFVHHGIRVQDFIYQARPCEKSYLAFLGRLRPEKGVHVAIEIADKIGLPLKIAGRAKPSDIPYFEEYIKPHIDSGLVEFVGELGPSEKMEFMGKAAALVNPTLIEEPFGLVVIEAMACGTPVIATPNGAMGEIIVNGKTGFIINPNGDVSITPEQIFKLDRSTIRSHVEQNFSSTQMANNYEFIFNKLVEKNLLSLNQEHSQSTPSTLNRSFNCN